MSCNVCCNFVRKNIKIIVFEPKKLLVHGIGRESKQAKRIIRALSVLRDKSRFIVQMNSFELKRTIEFIKERSVSRPFLVYFEDLNKWIASVIIMSTEYEVVFEVFEENFVLIDNNSEEV